MTMTFVSTTNVAFIFQMAFANDDDVLLISSTDTPGTYPEDFLFSDPSASAPLIGLDHNDHAISFYGNLFTASQLNFTGNAATITIGFTGRFINYDDLGDHAGLRLAPGCGERSDHERRHDFGHAFDHYRRRNDPGHK